MTTTRQILPNRRPSENISFECRNQSYVATLGFYPDGRLGEIFLRAGKVGTDLNVSTIETAIAVSFALQHGCDLNTMREAMPRSADGRAEGAVGKLLDIIAGTPQAVTP